MGSQLFRVEYVQLDGTKGELDAPTLEAIQTKLNKVRETGAKIVWVSDASIIDMPANNSSHAATSLFIREGRGPVQNVPTLRGTELPLPVMNFSDDETEAPAAKDYNGTNPFEMPVMNFADRRPVKASKGQLPVGTGGGANQALPLPAMTF